MNKKSNASKFAIGALLAAVVGFVTGILTAPKSGKETRQDIKDTTGKIVAEAEKELKDLKTQLDKFMGQAKTKAGELSGKAKKELEDLTARADSARLKAKDVLDGFRDGNSTDKDLSKAVKESKEALNHLKTYLKK